MTLLGAPEGSVFWGHRAVSWKTTAGTERRRNTERRKVLNILLANSEEEDNAGEISRTHKFICVEAHQ